MHNSTSNVRELLAATLLSDARLLAGAGGLQRPVQRVQWVEVLDDKADHFAPGDLLLTTAYNLRDDGALQHELAAQMLEFGVSAVVIKCGYYLDRVPAPVLAAADRLDLPILELDRSVAFVEVAQSIYAHLTARSTARMRRSAAVHRDLVQLVVDGGGLDQLVARAARLLDMPLAVTGEAGELLAAAPTPHRPAADAAAFPVVVRGLRRGAVWAAPGSGGDELVEQVAGVVALVAAGDDRRRRERSRLYAELVLDLVAGGEPAELLLRSRRLGVDVPEVAYVIAVETETAEAAPAARAALAERLPSGSLVVAAGSRLVAVVSEEGHQAATAEPDWLGTASVSAGISGPAAGVG
ncbi:MAG TPA: PucR family transcriptional regulator ligand-binding domain-containing protein, partial [Gaiellales bacterium]|nr:PucR family transcriptional regulator ligand-binding domain-containing protein [Gaiellales bacterium]